MKHRVAIRRFSQTVFTLFFIFIIWSTAYPRTGPFPAETFFFFDPFFVFMISIGARVLAPGLALSVAMIALTLLVGRFFCGWICPLGAIFDLVGGFSKEASRCERCRQ